MAETPPQSPRGVVTRNADALKSLLAYVTELETGRVISSEQAAQVRAAQFDSEGKPKDVVRARYSVQEALHDLAESLNKPYIKSETNQRFRQGWREDGR